MGNWTLSKDNWDNWGNWGNWDIWGIWDNWVKIRAFLVSASLAIDGLLSDSGNNAMW